MVSTSLKQDRQITKRQAEQREAFFQSLILLSLVVLLFFTLVPIILMVFLSLKDNGQIFGRFWAAPNPIRWENYPSGFEAMKGYITNSLMYSGVSVMGVVFLASLTGYVFARHRFPI